jgi:hypothetical protein
LEACYQLGANIDVDTFAPKKPWLYTNPNTVRGIEPATDPPDSELSAMADLKVFEGEDSLLDLLQEIYHHYAGMSVPSCA